MARFKELFKGEVYRHLAETLRKNPIITIVAESKTSEMKEALETLAQNIIEFKTYKSSNGQHAHLFEQLFQIIPSDERKIKESAASVPKAVPSVGVRRKGKIWEEYGVSLGEIFNEFATEQEKAAYSAIPFIVKSAGSIGATRWKAELKVFERAKKEGKLKPLPKS